MFDELEQIGKPIKRRELSEERKAWIDSVWHEFENESGYREPTREALIEFTTYATWMHDVKAADLILWIPSYFIADSIAWMKEI